MDGFYISKLKNYDEGVKRKEEVKEKEEDQETKKINIQKFSSK